MKSRFFKSIIGLFLLVNFSCNNSSQTIKIIYTNFSEEVSLSQNLIFRFSEDIVKNIDEMNELQQTTNPILFTPSIEGKFRWTDKNEVIFTPLKSLKICTKYVAKINESLKKSFQLNRNIDNNSTEFHTPFLKISSFHGFWTLNEQTATPTLKLNIDFNYPVKPNEFINKTKISINETPQNFATTNDKSSSEISVEIADKKALKEDLNIQLEIDKGFGPAESDYKTSDLLKEQLVVPSPYILSITSVNQSYEGNIGIISLACSQEIEESSLKNCYSIEPPLETTIEKTKNGFEIRGEFAEQVGYTLTINKTIKGVLGGQLNEPHTSNLMFGEMPPSINFINKKALYISSKGNQNIGLNITNIPEVNLKVNKIFSNNILLYLNNMQGYDWEYYEEDGEESYTSSNYYYEDYNEQYSQVIVDKTIETKNLPKQKNTSLLNVNLNNDKRFKGIYHIQVKSNGDDYSSASKLISISDIGILAKQSQNDLFVMTNSILTSDALSDVEVNLYSSNNQNLYTLKTDENGIAHFKDLESKTAGFKIAMITVESKEDFNFLLLKDNKIETARFETDGVRENKTGWWAYLYSARNIYRPGETIPFNAIVRNESMQNLDNIPLFIKLIAPNGKVSMEKRINTNEQGAASASFTTLPTYLTGQYTLQVLNSNDVVLNSQKISIEEFIPDKIKVKVNSDKEDYSIGQKIQINGEALTFFGPPSANRAFESELLFKRESFYSESHPNYVFNIPNKIRFEPNVEEGTTNENGLFSQTFDIPTEWQNTGFIKGQSFVTVFDENNRPVNRIKKFNVHTQGVYYGIARHDHWIDMNKPITFKLLALNALKKPINASNTIVEVYKIEWQNILENYNGTFKYNSKPTEKLLLSKKVSFNNGKVDFMYTPLLSGEFKIRVKQIGIPTGYSETSFYAYQYGSNNASSFEVDTDGEIIIESNKTKYNHNETAQLLFKTPFNGKLLVTVERNKILEYHQLETKDKTASLTLDLNEQHIPNIYINATLIKKMADNSLPLTVAHGLINISINKEKTEIPVSISCAENSRSKTKQNIKIKTLPNAEVTVSIVDEGILSIKNFKSPNPFQYFYQKRALMVNSFDLYARLFPEMTSTASGGDGLGLEKRVNPLSTNRFKPLSIWSGIMKANAQGEVNFEANIPQFYGAVRIMAVSYKDEAFGAAEKEVKIFDPLVISTSLPRFLSPNDEIKMGININNTTQTVMSINPDVMVEGPLQLIDKNNETIQINPGKEALIYYTLKAKNELGKGLVKVKIKGNETLFTEVTEISVRPAASFTIHSHEGQLKPGEKFETEIKDAFVNTPNTSIYIDNNPLAQITSHFLKLVRYPHGCAEQTISTAMPQILFPEFAKAVGKFMNQNSAEESELNPTYNVNQAIKKINNLISSDGNISYWPGEHNHSLYLNAYALHFLVECDKKGFEINKNNKSKLISLCTIKSSANLTEKESMNEISNLVENGKQYISREKIYALYVLALAGSPSKSSMNYCKMSKSKLHNSSQYILAATYALCGDMKSFNELMPKQYSRENDNVWNWYHFSSPIRDKALVLNALIESQPNHPQVYELAKSLSKDLKNNPNLNTIEMGFSITALGKFSLKNTNKGGKANVFIDQKQVLEFTGKNSLYKTQKAHNLIQINSTGTGNIFYTIVTEGIGNGKYYTEEDKGLTVRRTFLNRYGSSINQTQIKQNDLVIVKINISRPYGGGIRNIAITDILPAGLEIENPRITATKELSWMKNQSYPSYMDVRDDRINFFLDIGNNKTETLYYMCRAVSKGTFVLGPIQADAMYDPSIHSYHGKGTLIVN